MFRKLLDKHRDPKSYDNSGHDSRWILNNIKEIYAEDLNYKYAIVELETYVEQIKNNVYHRLGFLTILVKFLLNLDGPYSDPSKFERFKFNMRYVTHETDQWEEDWVSIINICLQKVYIGDNEFLKSIMAITK